MKAAERLAHLVVGRPARVLVAALVVAAVATPLALRVRLETDVVSLLPGKLPAARAFARWTHAFVKEQSLVILVESSDPARLLDFAAKYADALRGEPTVASVRARVGKGAADLVRAHLVDLLDDADLDWLAAHADRASLDALVRHGRALLNMPGGSSYQKIFAADPLGLGQRIAGRLKAGFAIDTTSGFFRGPDGTALVLLAKSKSPPFDVEADRALLDGVAARARALGATVVARPADLDAPPTATPRVAFTGTYAYVLEYRDWMHHDLTASTVASLAAVLFFFAALLGAVRVLPLVALPLGLGLWVTGALAATLYGRISLVSLAFAPILLAIGIDIPIQLYNRLREELQSTDDAREAIRRTIARLAGPSVIATLGPAAVCFSCALATYRGLGELGVLAGAGLVVNTACMLTVLPALLVAVPARLWLPRGRPARREGAWFAALGRLAARRPRLVLAIVGLLVAATVPAMMRVRYAERLVSVTPESFLAARVERELAARMGQRERQVIALVEDADPDRALARSDAWLAELERLERAGLLAGYDSVSSLFPSRATQEARRRRLDALGRDALARNLSDALTAAGFGDLAPFQPFLDELRHPPPPLRLADAPPDLEFLVAAHVRDEPGARLVATYAYPAPGRTDAAIAAMQHFAATSTADGAVTGATVLEPPLRALVARDTRKVSVASVLAVVLLLGAYYRAWRPTLAIVAPLAVAWALFAAALGGLGIPLTLFNLLAVPLVIGYGIDDHVFLVGRYLDQPAAGPAHALASTGRAIVVTSLSTIAGFAGLAFARFDGLRLLGTSGAIAVGLCLLAAFAVLPALLALVLPAERLAAAPPPDP